MFFLLTELGMEFEGLSTEKETVKLQKKYSDQLEPNGIFNAGYQPVC